MVEEAKIRITIDREQARRTLDEQRRAAPRRPAPRDEGDRTDTQRAGEKGAETQTGQGRVNLKLEAGRIAVARRFGGGITRAARFGVEVAALFAVMIPLIQTAIETGLEDSLGSDQFSQKVKDLVSAVLGTVTDTFQRGAAEIAGTITSLGEGMSLAKGFALTGQEFDSRFIELFGALRNANAMQFKARFDLSEAGLTQAARNILRQTREAIFSDVKEGMTPRK